MELLFCRQVLLTSRLQLPPKLGRLFNIISNTLLSLESITVQAVHGIRSSRILVISSISASLVHPLHDSFHSSVKVYTVWMSGGSAAAGF